MAETTDYFSDLTIRALAEEANGGGCSITINSILTDLSEMAKSDFSATDYSYAVVQKDGLLRVERELCNDQFLRIPNSGRELSNGVKYCMGFSGHTFGYMVNKKTFIPIIEMYDKRREGGCSYAIFNTAFGDFEDRIVSTSEDEHKVILGAEGNSQIALEDQRGWVAAAVVLNFIESAMEGGNRNIVGRLVTVLDPESAIFDALNFDDNINYERESVLRDNINKIIQRVGGIGIHDEVCIDFLTNDSPDGSATDWTAKTVLRLGLDGNGYDFVTQIAYPNAINTNPITGLRFHVGDRLGEHWIDTTFEDRNDPDAAFEFVEEKVGHAVQGGIEKRLNIETLSSEMQTWVHETYALLANHFSQVAPGYKPVFQPLLVSYPDNSKRLVLTDISSQGMDLARSYFKTDSNNYLGWNEDRKWRVQQRDARLVLNGKQGEPLPLNQAMDEFIAQSILDANPNAFGTMWLTASPGHSLRKKQVVQLSKGGYKVFKGKRGWAGSDMHFRPTVVCPITPNIA